MRFTFLPRSLAVALCLVYGLSAMAATTTPPASLAEAVSQGTTNVNLRAGYINNNPETNAKTTTATAVGGEIKYETKPWNRLQVAVAAYFSEKVTALSGKEDTGNLNGDFFDDNNDSYAYLGEAYIHYAWSNGSVRWGRQQLDTPFINTDNVRLLPHTYEAAWVIYQPDDNLKLQGGSVKKWSGYASGSNPGKFKRVSDDGAYALGAEYKVMPALNVQGWYYDFDNNFSMIYTDASYAGINSLELAAQFARYNETNNSNTEGEAYGLQAKYMRAPFAVSVAVNEASNNPGKSVSVGLCGCGSFFTSLDETNIAGKTDASAYKIAFDYQIFAPLALTLAYGHFEDANKATTDIDETNAIISYTFNKQADVEFVHTVVDNSAMPNDASTNFTRYLVRANYRF